MPQFFKQTDLIEKKVYDIMGPVFDILSAERSDFFDDAYICDKLGEILWESNRSPLSTAMKKEIFSTSFEGITEAFVNAGTFESYLTVFRKIFGDDVEVTFTVPGPGKLNIDILAQGIELSNFVAREVVSDQYELSNVVTYDGLYNIVFQTIKGFTSQYELEQMLFEMVPGGIYTIITLDLGA